MNPRHMRTVCIAAAVLTAASLTLPPPSVNGAAGGEYGNPPSSLKDEAAANDLFSPLELELLSLINGEREEQDLQPLTLCFELCGVARLHAEEMIDLGYFGHRSPKTGSPGDRVRRAGLSYDSVGENLAGNTSVSHAHQMLMLSRAHRANLLNPDYGHLGVAVLRGGRYGLMIVQIFTSGLSREDCR